MARPPARLPSGARPCDHVTLGVLTATVPAGPIDAVLADTGRRSRRRLRRPARLVVYDVMAPALYARAADGEVPRRPLEGGRWLRPAGADPALAGKSAVARARARLGADPLRELFARVARPLRPLAEPDTPGAWYRGRRLVGLDGTTIDPPDAPDLERRFGRPAAASRGAGGFPQLRSCACSRPPRPARARSSPSPSTATRPARSGWRPSCPSGCSPAACCARPTGPWSASTCGARPRPRGPTCCGGCAGTRSCRAGDACPTART